MEILAITGIVISLCGLYYAREQTKITEKSSKDPKENANIQHDVCGLDTIKIIPGFVYHLQPLGRVLGREQETDSARDRWLLCRTRPLLIWGPPGIGKTTLARAILHNQIVADQFKERRFEIHCDAFRSSEELLRSIAQDWFGIIPTSPSVTEAKVFEKLSEKPCAILVDNFETLFQLEDDRQRVSAQNFLVKLLSIDGLWMIVALIGHNKPQEIDWAGPVEPKPLEIHYARQLFCFESRRESHVFDPNLDNLIKCVSRIPHAIKLLGGIAAEYNTLEPVLKLWERFGIDLFQSPKGRTKYETITVAYQFAIEHLNQDSLRALKILACLPAGLARPDADVILPRGLLDTSSLYSSALVFIDESTDRVQLLSPLRIYIEKSNHPDSADFNCLIDFFLTIAVHGKAIHKTSSYDEILKFHVEWPNLVWAIEHGIKKCRPNIVRAAIGLARFSAQTGVGRNECIRLLEDILKLCSCQNNFHDKSLCLRQLGSIFRWKFDFTRSRYYYDLALGVCNSQNDTIGYAWCSWDIGEIARLICDYSEAQKFYKIALDMFKLVDVDENNGAAWSFWGIGETVRLINNAYARGFYQQKITDEISSSQDLNDSAVGQGACFKASEDVVREVESSYDCAVNIFQDTDVNGLGCCYSSLADFNRVNSNFVKATDLYLKAIKIFQGTCYKYGEAWCLEGLGDVLFAQNNFLLSHKYWTDALSLCPCDVDPTLVKRTKVKIDFSERKLSFKVKYIAQNIRKYFRF